MVFPGSVRKRNAGQNIPKQQQPPLRQVTVVNIQIALCLPEVSRFPQGFSVSSSFIHSVFPLKRPVAPIMAL
jgi:hypothetical protein